MLAAGESSQKNLVEFAHDGDSGVTKDVGDLGLAEAGGVVFEREKQFGIVEMETAEAVGIGKFAEGPELLVSERRLELEFGLEKCHDQIITGEARSGRIRRGGRWTK